MMDCAGASEFLIVSFELNFEGLHIFSSACARIDFVVEKLLEVSGWELRRNQGMALSGAVPFLFWTKGKGRCA
jgi:hypothetical protein